MGSSDNQRYAISCPHCETKLKVKGNDLGSSRSCPSCKRIFTLPNQLSAEAAAAKQEFSFSCRVCQTRLYARPDRIGSQIECPDCDTVNTVPAPDRPKPKQVLPEDPDPYRLKPLIEPPPKQAVDKQAQQFRVKCGVCNCQMYFRTNQIDTIEQCPDCGTKLKIAKPEAPLKKPTVKLKDPRIKVEPPGAQRSDQSKANELLAKARETVEEKAQREYIEPIKYPFREGIWTFPFTLSAFPFCLVLGSLISLVIYMLSNASQMSGLGLFVAVFLYLLAVGLAAITFVIAAIFWMTVISSTAMGHRQIKEFPRVDFFDWIRTSLFIVNAGGVSAAPGALLAAVVPFESYRSLLAIPGMFVFFPLVLMSMLDDESPVSIYSKTIHQSVRKCASSWMKFYLIAGVLGGLIALPFIANFFLPNVAWNYVFAFALVVAAAIYFRAFGRLAYVINDKMLVEPEEESEQPAPTMGPPPLPDSVH